MLRLVSLKLTDVSKVLTASIIRALMMEAVSTSETLVNFYQTTRLNIPENSHLHFDMIFCILISVLKIIR
jgi:hypothetical protein